MASGGGMRTPEMFNDTTLELQRDLAQSTPRQCVLLSHSVPSVQMYYAIRSKLESCSEGWLSQFLDLGGLDSLLDALDQMTCKGFTSFSDAILQLDCISCIRAVLNNSQGLDYLICQHGYVKKLAMALNSTMTLPKKQVFEILAAVTVYNHHGYTQVLDSLTHVKQEADQTHRFSIIMNDLKTTETLPHKLAILTFINCLINSTPDVTERIRIRNEFIGLRLLDVLSYIRKELPDDDLLLQLQVFHERKISDEEHMNLENNLDLNSPQDLVDNIQAKVFGTPKMVNFVNILQDLLAIETVYGENSQKLWHSVDSVLHHIVHTFDSPTLNNFPAELQKIPDQLNLSLQCLRSYQQQQKVESSDVSGCSQGSTCSNRSYASTSSGGRDSGYSCNPDCSGNSNKSKHSKISLVNYNSRREKGHDYNHNKVSCLDHTVYDNVSLPDLQLCNVSDRGHHKSSSLPHAVSPPSVHKPSQTGCDGDKKKLNRVARQVLPAPGKQMLELKWITLDDSKIVGNEQCVWQPAPERKLTMDFHKLENLFPTSPGQQNVEEVILLNQSTRLNINLFLSRLDTGPEELVHSLQDEDVSRLSLPMLQYLDKILPCPEEVAMLQLYTGHRLELGMAEQFVLLLADIPDYRVLLQGRLTLAEFNNTISKFKSSLSAMLDASKVILRNQDLKDFLHVILCAGNFLNFGRISGDAAGFKVCSLLRLDEVKSKQPCKSLLHYLVQLATDQDHCLLDFVKELLPLEKASSCSVSDLKSDINQMNNKLQNFFKNLSWADGKVQAMFADFFEKVKQEFAVIHEWISELRSLTGRLANYFCEDVSQFNVQECFTCLLRFCKQVKTCQVDNIVMEKLSQGSKQKTESSAKKQSKNKLLGLVFGKETGTTSSLIEDKKKVLERMLDQLHRGNFQPVLKSEPSTPNWDTLDFSSIPYLDSPYLSRPYREVDSCDETFTDTPKIHRERRQDGSRIPRMVRSSTQKIKTAVSRTNAKQAGSYFMLPGESADRGVKGTPVRTKAHARLSCLPSDDLADNEEEEEEVMTPHRKLFPREIEELRAMRHEQGDANTKATLLELPKLRATPGRQALRRSRSDLADSVCIENKWMKYEEIRSQEVLDFPFAPLAEPESASNISTLNLENQGKFITNEDVASMETASAFSRDNNVRSLQDGPVVILPNAKPKKLEKRSSVSHFFSKIGRAMMRPKSVPPDAENGHVNPGSAEPDRRSKKGHSMERRLGRQESRVGADDKFVPREYKRFKSEGSGKMSRFFRGSVGRTSKTKSGPKT